MECGVGEKARGYCLGSLAARSRGGLISKGGRETVVVVVVVTTVCWVAGANDRWPRVEYGGAVEVIGFCRVPLWGDNVASVPSV